MPYSLSRVADIIGVADPDSEKVIGPGFRLDSAEIKIPLKLDFNFNMYRPTL